MARKTNIFSLLLLLGFLASSCAGPSSDRAAEKDPVKCFWVRVDKQSSTQQRLAIINREINMKTDPSGLRKGEVSRLGNWEMNIFLAELEKMGFFDVAKPSFTGRRVKYVSLHIPSGNYYVSLDQSPMVYTKVVQAFTAYFNVGDTRFMTGSNTTENRVDFKKQKADLERSNKNARNRDQGNRDR